MAIRDTTTATAASHNNNAAATLVTDLPDEPEIVVGSATSTLTTTTTATPLYHMSFRHDDKLIGVPSSNVLSAESGNSVHSQSTYHHHTTTQATISPTTTAVGTPQPITVRYIKGRPILVRAKNAHLPDPVLLFKEKRKRRTVIASWTGGVIGFVAMGPFGAVIGAAGAYAAAKSVGKVRERKLLRRCTAQQQQDHGVHTQQQQSSPGAIDAAAPIYTAEAA
jgi:hypothetical protein